MGWGNIGLSWTRYAKSMPTRNCSRCHLDYPAVEDSCPHCSRIENHELPKFLCELEAKKKIGTNLVIISITALLLYIIIVLFVLPMYID